MLQGMHLKSGSKVTDFLLLLEESGVPQKLGVRRILFGLPNNEVLWLCHRTEEARIRPEKLLKIVYQPEHSLFTPVPFFRASSGSGMESESLLRLFVCSFFTSFTL